MNIRLSAVVITLLLFAAAPSPAQQAERSATSTVPHLIKYSGTLPNAPGRATIFDINFALYADQSGGDPLWTETQQVALDATGKYSVLLGSMTPLPGSVFATGQARWMGVTLSGEPEAARTILVATPYALKASDAETLDGHPLSDFTLKSSAAHANTAADITQINVGNGITGGGTGPTVTLGLSNSYLESLGNALYPQLAAANTFSKAQTFLSPVTFASGQGFPGTASLVVSNVFAGNQSFSGTVAIVASSAAVTSGQFTSLDGANNQGTAVWAQMTSTISTGDAVMGKNNSPAGIGVHAVGVSASSEGTFLRNNGSGTALWADTNASIATVSYGALVATADNNYAATFANNSTEATLYVNNSGAGPTGASVPVLATTGPGGACMISSGGDVACSGRIKSALPVAGTSQRVEVYSVQSSENWLEDFGSARLENGRITIAIDPQFARIANTSAAYHVFLTPRGDSAGLYVTNLSPHGFEVRESRNGSASIDFDYRIVAKRAGYETERLADATAEMHALTAHRDDIAARRATAGRLIASPSADSQSSPHQ